MRRASASGNIGAILQIISETAAQKPEEFILKTVGNIRFMYYLYLDKLHVVPSDVEDLIDGMLYLDARSYIEKQAMEKARMRQGK